MTSTTVTAALTIAEQDIFATSAEWDTQTSATESTRMSSRTPDPADKTTSSTCDVEAQQQHCSHFETATNDDDSTQLWKVVRRLRRQLKVEEQEKKDSIEAVKVNTDSVALAIGLEKATNDRVAKIEKSAHELRTMAANIRAERYAVILRRELCNRNYDRNHDRNYDYNFDYDYNRKGNGSWKESGGGEWCIRKEFSDGDWVTREKFVSYLRELTAPQSYTDIDIPRLSIKPLIVISRDGRDIRRVSLATLEAYMKAVRSLYKEQCLVDGIIPNDSLGNPEVEMILSEYENLLSYTTLTTVGDGDDDEEEEEDNGDDDADEENMDGANVSREGSPVQEESSRKETEASSTVPPTAPSVQESRQQSENEQEASKDKKPKKKSGSKRSGRALSPVSQSLDPHYVFAGTTQRHHLTHQTHWKEWCIRKRYADGHRVTAEKFVAFARELTARDEYYDKDNPHLCIKPFIVNILKGGSARRASKGTVRGVLTAVRAFYMDQCNLEKVKPNVTSDLAKTTIDGIMSDYEKL
ncbi:hypothetical protein BG015_002201 [Linnemannia schmuckeri]|uniref:Uncharacterized protein n=1 Tax=Linnemannia schmuckeri TaxID=64567 RepID=A0A9P5RNU9_9FUNG|nr:hypothetical protein BG015_002201 [Linnemannia schmuckeri]